MLVNQAIDKAVQLKRWNRYVFVNDTIILFHPFPVQSTLEETVTPNRCCIISEVQSALQTPHHSKHKGGA